LGAWAVTGSMPSVVPARWPDRGQERSQPLEDVGRPTRLVRLFLCVREEAG